MTTDAGQHRKARPRVVIIGSGFGGFFTARHLSKADLDVTVLAAEQTKPGGRTVAVPI